MEYIRIKTVTEEDFDQVITSAGGFRILEEGSADYRLNEAIIELKLVSEEGFEKTDRQRKLAKLFRETQPNRPVVLINPERLNESDSRNYYRIVEVPIKNACKKASKQLQITAERDSQPPVRVLVILNVGYTLLSPDEFKDVCFKCVRNDTSGIDWLVCGGIYFHSDKFDNYVIARFEDLPINLGRSFPSHDALGEAWGSYLNALMTEAIRNPLPFSEGRMPVIDLMFELDSIRYIKPAPGMPQSTFWPTGAAPRDNTSGIHNCPPVARTFPLLSDHEWKRFKDAMPSAARLKNTYRDWLKSYPDEELGSTEPLKPLVLIEVRFEDFAQWIKKPKTRWLFSDIGEFSSEVLHHRAMSLLEDAKEKEQTLVVPLDYIHLIVNEVGNDKANDFASIYFVSEVPGFERKEPLVENAKLFFEYGMAVAAAYAIKRKVNTILFTKVRIR
ncbi:MAG: hypothetical protein HZA90_24135 [Verrucomicrobia bacterium]|nr:hypothetical protein [Verrucomicrobiota bacterium]